MLSYAECEQLTKTEKFVTKFDKQNVKRQALVTICLDIGHVIIGCVVCWSAPVFQKLQDPELTPLDRPMTDEQASWLAAILYLGIIAGSQTGAFLSNIFGRKPTLLLCAIIMFSSSVIMLLATNFTTLFVGRVVSGLGVGGMISGDLVYIGEMASSHLRGIILASTGVFHTLGGLLIFSVGPFVSYSTVESILIALSIIHVLGLFSIPESPVYHVIKGNDEAARETLLYLGRSKDIDTELKTLIHNVKARNMVHAQNNKTKTILPSCGWLDIFKRKRNRRALLITTILFMVQEGAGIICIMSFATSIFRKAASSVNPDVATILLGVTQVFGILTTLFLVERFGRRVLLLFSTSSCAFCTALLAAHFYLELINHPILDSTRWIPLATLMSFLFCYNAGLGIIPNVLVGEMFSPNVRSTGSSMAVCLCSFAAFVSSLSFGYIIMMIGSHVMFIIFAIINILGFMFTLKFVPETKGKSLTEVETMLAND